MKALNENFADGEGRHGVASQEPLGGLTRSECFQEGVKLLPSVKEVSHLLWQKGRVRRQCQGVLTETSYTLSRDMSSKTLIKMLIDIFFGYLDFYFVKNNVSLYAPLSQEGKTIKF